MDGKHDDGKYGEIYMKKVMKAAGIYKECTAIMYVRLKHGTVNH